MNKWIYIKSDRLIDAFAVASVLAKTNDGFAIARKARFASLFSDLLPNVKYDFFPAGDENELIKIEPNNSKNITESLVYISKQMGINCDTVIDCNNLVMPSVNLDINQCVMLTPEEQEIDLQLIDYSINSVQQKGYNAACAGMTPIPCIRGTKDYRGILKWIHIPALAKKDIVLITNNEDYAQLADSYKMKNILLSNVNNVLFANGIRIEHPDELSNIIQRTIIK